MRHILLLKFGWFRLQAGLFSFSTPSRYSPKQQYFGQQGGFVKRFLVFEKIIVFYPLELLTAE
jgi:hypothetical protein